MDSQNASLGKQPDDGLGVSEFSPGVVIDATEVVEFMEELMANLFNPDYCTDIGEPGN